MKARLAGLVDFLIARLARIPTTNLRLVSTSALLWVHVILVDTLHPPADVLWPTSLLLGAALGLDVTQFGVKRKTFDPNAQTRQNAGESDA